MTASPLLIAQITDIHLGFDRGNADEPNLRRFLSVLAHLKTGPNRPDLLLLTGDLTEHGDAASYHALARAVADCPFPVWPIPGNHDNRAAFLACLPDTPRQGPFAQYALEYRHFRILCLDTHEPGRHGGGFCATRATWLRAELAAHPHVPTLIAMHHPPIVSGIDWMDPDPAEPWITRFAEAISGHGSGQGSGQGGQLQGILCGHLHRAIHASFAGVPVLVSPSSAPAVTLDLSPIDPETPDERAVITDEPPAYALHRWDGRNLVSHFDYLTNGAVLARFDASLQATIRAGFAERGEA